jgi:exonuclease SbcD
MRIIHLADLHAGCYRYGEVVNGYHEADRDLQGCLNRVFNYSPDIILIAGDVYDNPNPPSASRTIISNFLNDCRMRKKHVFIIPGNHDYKAQYSSLLPEENLCLHTDPMSPGYIHVINDYYYGDFNFGEETLSLVAFGTPLDAAWERNQNNLRITSQKFPVGSFKLLMVHAPVKNAQLQEHNFLPRGLSKEVIQAWEECFDYVALGDIHKQQQISYRTWYAGSPRKLEFANLKDQHGCLLLETRRNELQRVEALTLGGRPFTVLRLEEEAVEEQEVHGYVVKAILENSRLEAGRIHNLIMSKGALFCVTEYHTPQVAVRQTSEVDLAGVIEAYFQQAIPAGVDRKKVLQKFKEYYESSG